MNTQTIDTDQIKQAVNLVDLAGNHAELRRESTHEYSGPCPKCGGADRFHVAAEWFFCRHCHPKRGDAFEFMTWLHGATFKEAAAMLTGGAMPTPAAVRRPEAGHRQPMARSWDATEAARRLAEYQQALWDEANVTAHEYLEQGRGLEPQSWLLFDLGYRHDAPLPNTWDAEKRAHCHPPQPAIVIPWYHKQELVGLRFRFLQGHTYVDINGTTRTEKATSRGVFSGHVFGGQVIKRCNGSAPVAERTLVICEGELNAMSIWQVAGHTKVDALSLGSESQKLTPALIAYAQRYRLVLLWADREEIAKQLMAVVPGAMGITSEMCKGQDANDLLQAGHLGGYLSAWRFHAAKSDEDRAALLLDLRSGADTLIGVDEGTRQVMGAINVPAPLAAVAA
jgi:hypothetical protein